MEYQEFLKSKVVIAEKFGIDTSRLELNESLFPHQKDIVNFCLEGGRRAIFASFGLGKTFMQLEIAKQLIKHTGKPFLIVCPLGVAGEFKQDARNLEHGLEIAYITNTNSELKPIIYLTNYERVRMANIDPLKFCGVSFDEASILRNLGSETTDFVLKHFKKLPFRFVATATPTPNDYIEILNYADYLGVISRGHALTRFFQRDSTKAGHLTLYPNKKKEFWQWVSTWAAFINKPSDLGYSDEGYDLPPLNVIEHCISYEYNGQAFDKNGTAILFKDTSKSLVEVSREKRDSIEARLHKTKEIADSIEGNVIIWHHRESERAILEKTYPDAASVFGSMDNDDKEGLLIGFANGEHKHLLTKPEIAGSGCNFQYACHNMIFAGIDYKFNDFIQAVHRCYRFRQTNPVNVHIIYTDNEYEVMKVLRKKWQQHTELHSEMTEIIREYGLNSNLIQSQMARQIFNGGTKVTIGDATLYNNDTVVVHADKEEMKDNSVGMVLTSIPFGDHYEYSENYNDFGHNYGNKKFFEQMDFLIPNLYRVLSPGRVAAIHVKDRIRYSHQNGTCFTTISDFSGQTVQAFEKHGFFLVGKITVTTDVVRENNQTYRLTWGEQRKDGTKMGVGLPEYILLFRKPPSDSKNAYADDPVVKSIDEYLLSLWQLDAHAYWKSSGDRFLSSDELCKLDMKKVYNLWKKYDPAHIYSFQEHLRVCEDLDKTGRLSKLFMTIPPISNSDMVWTDINRMNTLNTNQVSSKKEKHICPLQLDIIERLVYRFTNAGDVVDDPFGGLFSTPYKSLELGRRAISAELNTEYFNDGCFYVKGLVSKMNMPTLFDTLNEAV